MNEEERVDLNHARVLAGMLSTMDTWSSLPGEASVIMLELVQEVERLRRLVPRDQGGEIESGLKLIWRSKDGQVPQDR